MTPVDVTATSPENLRPRPAPTGPGAGTRLTHFRLERPLGHGGMGEVWLATDVALDREVAVKLLPAARADDPDRRARLVREARAQARLRHPNVCHIYYVGEDDGRVFFAMEHVDGETLAQRIARGPVPPAEALELTRMAALGLREAHRAGFTHRDVKPSNLMVDGHGVLKVLDFGLVGAHPAADAGAGRPAETAAVGTPLYMAPEQARGEVVDVRADIYALGATLHHLIAGAPPFAGDTLAELRSCHETAPRPPVTTVGRTRAATELVDGVIARMMAKRREDRFADYDELIAALDRANPARTRAGGLWARAYASMIDGLMLAPLVVPPMLLIDGLVLLDFVIGLAVYAVVLPRYGTTPGHALLDLEVVDHATGRRPTALASVRRQLVLSGPVEAGFVVSRLAGPLGVPALDLIGAVLVAVACLLLLGNLAWVSARTLDKRAVWDRFAGTQVRYRARTSS